MLIDFQNYFTTEKIIKFPQNSRNNSPHLKHILAIL